ncbi:MAG: hypothetical protein A2Y25_09905 [Candidatus Melainabacteria bacterium GWF2_37_15]|nr:MAG: hypothetical protein A2Y25_09905 [Candidatus Melainabacteria bacterium GWF2_37_15]
MNNKCKIAFNTKFVSSLTGASVSQLNSWDKSGLVKPSIVQSEGRGSIRLYSFEDIIEVKTIIYLRQTKVSMKKIKTAIEYLKKELKYNRPLKEAKLISNGEDILFTYEDVNKVMKHWIAANKYGQLVFEFVVPLEFLVDDIQNKIIKYEKRLNKSEEEYKKGNTVSLDSVKEKYFGISGKVSKRSRKRS